MKRISEFGIKSPVWALGIAGGITLLVFLLALLPSLYPETFSALQSLKVDTDPENMLAEDEPARVFHREKRAEFGLYDTIVLGVLNREDEAGVFNPESLQQVYALTEYAASLDGVIAQDIMAPSNLDNIEQAGMGAVSFDWIMPRPPETQEEALNIRDRIKSMPMLEGTLISKDSRSLMLSIPLESKDMSYRISQQLESFIGEFGETSTEYYITGLPVANDTFGVEMFIQMAISAPMAMLLIFILMWIFFKRLSLIISPMVVAVMSVILTMGLLIITGNTVHIMSSMIPIFIMPIAVLDAVHILSDFYDKYPHIRDRKETIRKVVETLWKPMMYTSLTTTAGFASLALAPIPPVQVFGIFVALGVLLAWLLTMILIPAMIVLLPEAWLENFGHKTENENDAGWLGVIGQFTGRKPRWILSVTAILVVIAGYGISQIVINDNPVKWFEKDHSIRIADTVLNEEFGGTYPAYLVLDAGEKDVFKDPETLRHLDRFQQYLETVEAVGNTQALPQLVKTIYRELLNGDEDYFRIPDQSAGVAQTLLTFESSHHPDDLWNLVTPDYDKAIVWFQLKSGDNQEMTNVVNAAGTWLEENPFPHDVETGWFGLTYINVVWQDKMVVGMLEALLSSFVIVLILMTLLFRSPLWGLLSMIPLTVTIGLIYGLIGLVGKNYDMPVAVLSSLSLGLSIDYAIHFLARSRELRKQHSSWPETLDAIYGEPARAIFRNIIVVGIGFLPLLLAPLVPYQTVGYLISGILITAGAATLLILPALMTIFHKLLFKTQKAKS